MMATWLETHYKTNDMGPGPGGQVDCDLGEGKRNKHSTYLLTYCTILETKPSKINYGRK